MIRIGFFVGHDDYKPHADILVSTLKAVYPSAEIVAVISKGVTKEIEDKRIQKIAVKIPESLKKIPFGDKVYAAAIFEDSIWDEMLWLDVDSIFIKPVIFPKTSSICVNPVDKRNIGCPFDEAPTELWEFLYHYFGISLPKNGVRTTVTKEIIFPYFNIGMFYTSDPKHVMRSTVEALMDLLKSEKFIEILVQSEMNRIFLHQAVFTCAVLKSYGDEISSLPYGLNYPIHLEIENAEPIPSENWLSIRYDNYFDENPCPEALKRKVGEIGPDLKSVWYY